MELDGMFSDTSEEEVEHDGQDVIVVVLVKVVLE